LQAFGLVVGVWRVKQLQQLKQQLQQLARWSGWWLAEMKKW
jgi:hypothetical protein